MELGSIRRFEREMEHEDQQRCQEINKRMGFEGWNLRRLWRRASLLLLSL